MKKFLFVILILISTNACADSTRPTTLVLKDEGSTQGSGTTETLNCVGTYITCSKSGTTGTITVAAEQPVGTGDSPSFVAVSVQAEAYDATGWNGDLTAPTKDDVRDKMETLAGAAVWTNSGTLDYLTTSSHDVTIGNSTDYGKFGIVGDADEIQLNVRCNATQTANCINGESSAGTDFLSVTPSTFSFTGSGSGYMAVGNGSTSQGDFRILEDTDNGSNYIKLTTAASLAADYTLTLPSETDTLVGAADPVFTGSLQLPNGASPTTDAAGEIAIDTSATTGAGIRLYADAAYTIPAYQCRSFVLSGVTASGDFGNIWKSPWAITMRSINVVQVGATNVVGQLDECDSNGANCATIDSSDITADGNNDADDGSLSNASVDANDWVGWHTTSVSGTNTNMGVTFCFSVDQA